MKGPVQLAASDGAVVADGTPAVIATLRYGDTEYRVIQTVEMLMGAG